VVIPVSVREEAGLLPGAVLQVSVDETGIRLERVADGPTLVKVGKRLIAQPRGEAARPEVDVPSLVEEERNRWP
jgi:bifunctional DNA-binding transcriptional regulator/antitoxin component of YhaV-PrlF toxin-antitoxin module